MPDSDRELSPANQARLRILDLEDEIVALRERVAVLTEERDAERERFLALGRFVEDALSRRGLLSDQKIEVALPRALDRIEEADRRASLQLVRIKDATDACTAAEARVAVLEAGLRDLADAADAMSASRTAWNAPSLNRSLRDAATAARALLGGVPAAAPEREERIDTAAEAILARWGDDPLMPVGPMFALDLAATVIDALAVPAAAPEPGNCLNCGKPMSGHDLMAHCWPEGHPAAANVPACPTCGSTDRAVRKLVESETGFSADECDNDAWHSVEEGKE